MPQLYLFKWTSPGGVDHEFVIIETENLTKEQLKEEYGSEPVGVAHIDPSPVLHQFPTDRALVEEGQ